MLTMTHDAASIVDSAREEQGVPEDYGLRIYPQLTSDGVTIGLSFASQPTEGDQVAVSEGQRIFVASELVDQLSDAVIDAHPTPDGTGLVLKQPAE
ncbi:MAG: hypothetical protein ACREQY_01235 [Candidatus Binatia bacterium]